jgi:hypothetical protein
VHLGDQSVTGADQSVDWRALSCSLNLDLDVLLERVWLLVACEADSGVLEELMADRVPQSVVFPIDRHGPLVMLSGVLFILETPRKISKRNSLTFGCSCKERYLSFNYN